MCSRSLSRLVCTGIVSPIINLYNVLPNKSWVPQGWAQGGPSSFRVELEVHIDDLDDFFVCLSLIVGPAWPKPPGSFLFREEKSRPVVPG